MQKNLLNCLKSVLLQTAMHKRQNARRMFPNCQLAISYQPTHGLTKHTTLRKAN